MTDIEKYINALPPALSKKEQKELFKKFKEEGDQKAREKLISHNLRLAINVVMTKVKNTSIEFEDAVQIATYALVKAVDNFDITKELEFSTYAVPCIKQNLIREIENSQKRVKTKSFYEEVDENKGAQHGDPKLLIDFISDDEESHISYDYQYNLFKKKVQTFIKDNFTEREKFVYNALIGNGYEKPQTLTAIGKSLGVSHQMVAIIKRGIKEKLTNEFSADYPSLDIF